jgi:hypothetical protein
MRLRAVTIAMILGLLTIGASGAWALSSQLNKHKPHGPHNQSAAQKQYGVRPGKGCGDKNHVHTGPPGNPSNRACPKSVTERLARRGSTVTVSGQVVLPQGVSQSACQNPGTVRVLARARGKGVAKRTTRLRSNCTFKAKLRVRKSKLRKAHTKRVTITSQFLGNASLRAKSSRARSLRVR